MKAKSFERRYAEAYDQDDLGAQVAAAKVALRQEMLQRGANEHHLDETAGEVARRFANAHDAAEPDIEHAFFVCGLALGQFFTTEFFGGAR